jgi:hypothetical protein
MLGEINAALQSMLTCYDVACHDKSPKGQILFCLDNNVEYWET